MQNFHRIAQGVDVMPLTHAVMRRPYLWNANTFRRIEGVDEALLRYSNPARLEETGKIDSLDDELECVDFPEFGSLAYARKLVFDLMQRVEGERLGRIGLLRLPKAVSFGYDAGESAFYAAYYTSYLVVLNGVTSQIRNGFSAAFIKAGDDMVGLQSGDVWWFDHRSAYQIVNESPDELILMRVDVRTAI